MSTNSGCCSGTTTTTCDSTIAELPRYYPRQLITPDDLTLEQNYFRDRLRRHNRLLHGWGVVCGAVVCPVSTVNLDGTTSFTPWQVKVQTGYILGPYGDEIIVDCCRTVDVRTSGVTGVTGQPCVDAPDPWCTQVFNAPSVSNTYYIAVQYKQTMVRPVRVQPVGCGCDDTHCEYSRLQDGYQIGVLTSCPSCNACDPNVGQPQQLMNLPFGGIPSCPDCSCGPWVCLAQVTVSSDGLGTIQQIDNNSCRRMVLSFCNFWWKSTASPAGTPTITSVTDLKGNPPGPLTADGKTATMLLVNGTNLEIGSSQPGSPQPTYSFGSGFAVTVQGQTANLQTGLTSVQLSVVVQTTVSPGTYNLTVVNVDCSVAVKGGVVQVQATAGSGVAAAAARRAPAAGNAPGAAKPAAKPRGAPANAAAATDQPKAK